MITGRCLCGGVRFRISGKLGPAGYCRCGSLIYSRSDGDPPIWRVRLGTLDGDPGRHPAHRVGVANQASWHEITDALPQLEASVSPTETP